MKQLIIISMCVLISGCTLFKKNAVDTAVGICKSEKHKIKILYLDSTHDVTKVDTLIKGDTLILKIYVSFVSKHDGYLLDIGENIKFINYGKKTILYETIPICIKVSNCPNMLIEK
jgi:hypothetical protein